MPFFIESLPFLPLGWAGRVQRAAAAAGGALDQAVTSFRRLQPVRPFTRGFLPPLWIHTIFQTQKTPLSLLLLVLLLPVTVLMFNNSYTHARTRELMGGGKNRI